MPCFFLVEWLTRLLSLKSLVAFQQLFEFLPARPAMFPAIWVLHVHLASWMTISLSFNDGFKSALILFATSPVAFRNSSSSVTDLSMAGCSLSLLNSNQSVCFDTTFVLVISADFTTHSKKEVYSGSVVVMPPVVLSRERRLLL